MKNEDQLPAPRLGEQYQWIRALKKEQDVGRVEDLLAMPPVNDPFYRGQKAHWRDAEWFQDIWEQFGYSRGVHLRRVHYRIVSHSEPVLKPNGTLYENTETDWVWLNNASKSARLLGLLPAGAFVDRRNPAPRIFYDHSPSKLTYEVQFGDWEYQILNDMHIREDLHVDLPLPAVDAYFRRNPIGFPGYDTRLSVGEVVGAFQPYLVEIWIEKSTMNDILIPLCRQWDANLVAGDGFESITAALECIGRVRDAEKPARILYISDFDPAGDCIPRAVARQLEFWNSAAGCDLDIKVHHIALTRDQVAEYQLPRIPIKATDKRKARFEDRFGEGACELDALEAIHPGVLGQLVKDWISKYRAKKLKDELQKRKTDLQESLDRRLDEVVEEFEDRRDDLEEEIEEIARRYRDELKRLAKELQDDLQPVIERARGLQDEIADKLDELLKAGVDTDLDLPTSTEAGDEADGNAYFDSKRGYLEQLKHYRSRDGDA